VVSSLLEYAGCRTGQVYLLTIFALEMKLIYVIEHQVSNQCSALFLSSVMCGFGRFMCLAFSGNSVFVEASSFSHISGPPSCRSCSSFFVRLHCRSPSDASARTVRNFYTYFLRCFLCAVSRLWHWMAYFVLMCR